MVAQFLGSPSMNIMKCSYVSSNKLQIKFDGISFEWSRTEARALSDYPDKSNLLVGFRPEDASFVPDGVSGKESIGIPAEVYISEPAGTYSVITLKSGDNLVKVFSTMEAEEKIGDKGYINVKDGRLSIFDGSSGKRIV